MYLVTFNKYDTEEKTSVSNGAGGKLITNTKGEGFFRNQDLKSINRFGCGIQSKKLISSESFIPSICYTPIIQDGLRESEEIKDDKETNSEYITNRRVNI